MARRLIVILLSCCLAWPALAGAMTSTSSTAETYRRAAELWKWRAGREREKRKGVAEDLDDALRMGEAWKEAARKPPEEKTPEWVWPSAAGLAITAFVVGFLVGHRDRRE